jgi:hypothetical protein
MSDTRLVAMMAVLLVANMLVLVTWWLIDPRTVHVTSVTPVLVNSFEFLTNVF